jgi:hypothetical protein
MGRPHGKRGAVGAAITTEASDVAAIVGITGSIAPSASDTSTGSSDLSISSSTTTGGSGVVPHYSVRRPMIYHLFEMEVKRISALNAEAVACFSVGSFSLSLCASMCLEYIFASRPLSDAAIIVLQWGPYFFGVVALVCFVFGIWSLWRKRSDIEQIKEEHRDI